MTATERDTGRDRHLLILDTPPLWPAWPFLPLIRRTAGRDEYGLLYDPAITAWDAQSDSAHTTHRRTSVVFANLFLLPATEAEFLALPQQQYESPATMYADGWQVD